MEKKINNLTENILELAMTNDYLLKEVEKYRLKYMEEHKKVLEFKKKEEKR